MFNKLQKKMYFWLDGSMMSFGIKGDLKKKKQKVRHRSKKGLESTSHHPTKMLCKQLGAITLTPSQIP